MSFTINGIQHIAIGVNNAIAAAKWYKENYNFTTHINKSTEDATYVKALTGGRLQHRTCIQIANIHGSGGALNLWQYTSRPQQENKVAYGMLGINAILLNCFNMHQLQMQLKQDHIPSYPIINPQGNAALYVSDYFNHNAFFTAITSNNKNAINSGVNGAIIGVSNVDESLAFYKKIFPNLLVEYDQTGKFSDLVGAENKIFRRLQFSVTTQAVSTFSAFLGTPTIQLLQAVNEVNVKRTYDNKFWGDVGIMHIAFDVVNAAALKTYLQQAGIPIIASSFEQVTGSIIANHIYIKDVDGTVILFTELLQMTLNKKWNWHLKITAKNQYKRLPKWKLNLLGLQKMGH